MNHFSQSMSQSLPDYSTLKEDSRAIRNDMSDDGLSFTNNYVIIIVLL
jgi:hypothetical protein